MEAAAAQVMGANLFQKSYLRNNLRAVLEMSLLHIQRHYSDEEDGAACELSGFMDLVNLEVRGMPKMNDILVIPCLNRLATNNLALAKNSVLTALHDEPVGPEPNEQVAQLFAVVDEKLNVKIWDHVGLYVVLVEKWVESEPVDDLIMIDLSGRLIATVPPIVVNAEVPILQNYLCNPYFVVGSDVCVTVQSGGPDASYLFANDALRAELTFTEYVSGKRTAEALENVITYRNSAGFTVATNDGRLVQLYEKSTHDKSLQHTQAFMRLLWSSPAKRVALFGAFDHRYDSDLIMKALSAAHVAEDPGPAWTAISYYPQIQKLRVFQDPAKLEKFLCWKATATDHNVLSAAHFLPVDSVPYFGSTDHLHFFGAMKNLGLVLAVCVHIGYVNVMDATEQIIRLNKRLFEVPDNVLTYVFVMMLESIGKDLNDMTTETGDPEWATDLTKGVRLIQRHAAKYFTMEFCLRINDDWSVLHKDKYIPWSDSGSSASSVATPPVAAINDFCIRDVRHFFSFKDAKGNPPVACASVGCKMKHLVRGVAPNKDAITKWLLEVKGKNGITPIWRSNLVTAVKNF